ncbi:MAG: hypothetical protein K8R79_09595 [Calditrichales bacterium]|nr:hypothetical protein [Calditrichales bacterium]
MPLCRQEPARIGLSATQKPLQRIAAYLGGQEFLNKERHPRPRTVNIVDCGQRKDMDLKVITPVKSFGDLPESSVWQPVYEQLYELIRAHKTTLVFANMRAQTEKIARQLNELHQRKSGDPKAELALAHHGSISREERYKIEDRLKNGKIPAVIATASLELGIDVGGIDLVVHLEAPKSVSSALQRVGRSGHLLSAVSKGRIIPLYPSDLDDAVAIARCMHHADIEETTIPENALDVLAQQITAETAVKKWLYQDLYRLTRQSYCYRNLSPVLFKSVVEMLGGRFAESAIHFLHPRLNWDKVNNILIPRRGSRLTAVMNSGTIPDRGYFGVYLQDNNIKLGEVEEEFVYESRVGMAFFLGNSEWRIAEITKDRIVVTPIAAIKPKEPFWKGDTLFRDFSTSEKIGQFRGELLAKIDQGEARDWLVTECFTDADTAANIVRYFERQRKHSSIISTDKQLAAEWSVDGAGEPLFILHAPFGAKVNGAWAVALTAALEQRYQSQVQYSFDDDGILIRPLETTESPPMEMLFKLSPDEVERLVIKALPDTPLFAVHFRYNTARALLLPRSQPNKRIPLWLQRLRSADLLQAVGQYEDFPIIIETYRDCLQDVFDLQALKKVIKGLNNADIRVHFINTPFPSPMASGILFKFTASNIYELDQKRQPGQGLAGSNKLLTEILEKEHIPCIVTQEIALKAEQRWQCLTPEFQASNIEDLFSVIQKLGPIENDELDKRCKSGSDRWIKELSAANRIIKLKGKNKGWITAGDKSLFAKQADEQILQRLIISYLQSRAPVTVDQIERDLSVERQRILSSLEKLYQEKKAVRGKLAAGIEDEQWCERYNFSELYRTAIARRRTQRRPADRSIFYRFLLEWHHIAKPAQPLLDVLKRYSGFCFPLHFFERAILGSRYLDSTANIFSERLHELESLIANGEVIVHSGGYGKEGGGYVHFMERGKGGLFFDKEQLLNAADGLTESGKTVFNFLHENGASYLRDLESGAGLYSSAISRALNELAERGLASCENYQAFLLIMQAPMKQSIKTRQDTFLPNTAPAWARSAPKKRPARLRIQKAVYDHKQLHEGRWFLTTSFAALGKPLSEQERAETQARLLLNRYGVLVKEWYRRERGLPPWYEIFQALKRLEWQGEIRRGYFVDGLSGVQFASAEAVDALDKIQREQIKHLEKPVLLSVIDPALPFGGAVKWDLADRRGNKISVVRSAANHLLFVNSNPVLYSENYASRLWTLDDLSEDTVESITGLIKNWLKLRQGIKPKRRIEIETIDGESAAQNKSADLFIKCGFEKNGNKLVLWQSAV